MVKITRSPVRAAVLLAGMALGIAGVLAPGGRAVAGPATGRPGLRAEALAQLMRHGIGLRPGGVGAAALPGGVRNVPKPGKNSHLNGVFCTSSDNCWAVGGYTPSTGNAELNQVLHWNGKKWSLASAPSPGGKGSGSVSELFAVRCASARYCWAVGDYAKGGAQLNQALLWNGKKWSKISTPSLGGTISGAISELFDVNCTSSASCLASGEFGSQTGNQVILLNQVLRWNGKRWSVVDTPDPAGTNLGDVQQIDAIRCGSARNCLAIGTYGTIGNNTFKLKNQALHWNGRTWSKIPTPDPGGTSTNGDASELLALGCSAASSCFAAGFYGNLVSGPLRNQILRWNGKKWSLATTPDPGGTGAQSDNELVGASCLTASNCWAIGFRNSTSGSVLNEALRWNGKKWSLAGTPNPAGSGGKDKNELADIRCVSASRCFAVGGRQKGGAVQNEILRWNGTKWSTG
jgi:hypothetical protein